jgi:hypothetical protein
MRANAEVAARQSALALPVIKPLYEQGLSLRAVARELEARRGSDCSRRPMVCGAGE